jgi:hypothetical protein
MKLKDFLALIHDEEARIELEIDEPDKDEYQYYQFWFSDYITSLDIAKYYREYQVVSFGFTTEENHGDIQITIKP